MALSERALVRLLEPRSAYVLRDVARWRWQHAISPTKRCATRSRSVRSGAGNVVQSSGGGSGVVGHGFGRQNVKCVTMLSPAFAGQNVTAPPNVPSRICCPDPSW
jgi:hypothetical protein